MLLLGVETSSKVASVCAVEFDMNNCGTVLAEINVRANRSHSQILVPQIHECLNLAGANVQDIDRIAVCIGPGSYTGIRIGIATVKGLAFDRDIPTAGVSSLAGLAAGVVPAAGSSAGIVFAVKRARGRLCYAATFENGKRSAPDRVISYEDLAKALNPGGVYTFVGDGAEELLGACKVLDENFTAVITSAIFAAPRAVNICLAAAESDFKPPSELSAAYLEITKAEKEREGLL